MNTSLHTPVLETLAAAPASPRPRLGEPQSQAWIHYGRPDVAGAHLRHYKRARIAVVGDGENVERVLHDLDALAHRKPGTTVTHVTRRRCVAHAEAATPTPGLVEGFRVHGFYPTEGGVMLEGDDGRWIGPFDRLIVDDEAPPYHGHDVTHAG